MGGAQMDGAIWGIGGTQFSLLFLLIAAVVTGVVEMLRRFDTEGTDVKEALSPAELALLSGGERRAVAASLAALRLAGLVEAGTDGRIRAAGPVPEEGPALDLAVLRAAAHGARVGDLAAEPGVARELARVRAALVAKGQLLGAAQRRRMRLYALPLTALCTAGAARAVADALDGELSGGMVMVLAVFGFVALAQLLHTPERTRIASLTLMTAESRHRALHPAHSPSYAEHGPESAAFAVAVFGGSALLSMDPAFAAEAEVNRQLDQQSGWTTTPFPAHSSSSCSSSSSCGSSSSSCSSSSCSSSSSSCSSSSSSCSSSSSSCGGGS